MRRLGSLLLVAMLLGALAAPVAAAGPSGRGAADTPLGTYDVVIPSSIGCAGFDVLVEDISGRITDIYRGTDGRGYERFSTQYRTVSRYTRLDSVTGEPTGDVFVRSFHSLAQYVYAPDGTLYVKFSGDFLGWAPEVQAMGLADGIWLVESGNGTVTYGLDFVDATLRAGRLIDICAELN